MFIILRRGQQGTIVIAHTSSCKVPVVLIRYQWNLRIFRKFVEKIQVQNFVKIPPVETEFVHADGRTDMTKLGNRLCCFAGALERDGVLRKLKFTYIDMTQYGLVVAEAYLYCRRIMAVS
jgi:hypothetical protein